MNPEVFRRAKALFEEALERDGDGRDAFLDEACGDDAALRRQVHDLLAADEGPPLDGLVAEAEVADPVPDEPPAGERIGPYEILAEIGHGGMGIVYLARHVGERFEIRVALKVIRRGMDTEFVVRRFLAERQILASLDHPNIAKLYDGGASDDGVPWFAMEYVEGENLLDWADRSRLPVAARIELFRSVLAGIQYAHQHLVVHRDIKPGNILVTKDGVPKLLDFGLAKLLDSDAGETAAAHTVTQLRMLTPAFASPEQIRGEPVTTASDVYSLGVLLYMLLTGQKPYRLATDGYDELARAVCEQAPTKPSVAAGRSGSPERLQRRLSGDLDSIVLKAMRKEPERRYATANALSEDLRRHLEGLPVSARPDSAVYRARKFVSRHRSGVGAAALVLVVAAAGFVQTARERARAERRFEDVRKLASAYLFEFHDAIADLSGATPARQLVVRRALEYLESLDRDSHGDPSLRRELAAAYEKVGDVQGGGHFGNLGDTAGARASYLKALAIRENLVRNAGGGPADRASLVDSRIRMSEILARTGDVPGGEAAARQAVSDARGLADPEPLAKAYHALATSLSRAGDSEGAIDLFRKEAAIFETLCSRDPSNARARRGLALSHKYIGGKLAALKRHDESVKSYRSALAIEEAAVAADPASATAKRDLSFTLSDIGYNLLALRESQAGLESYRRAAEIRAGLAAADPQDVTLQRGLSSILLRLANAEVQAGEPAWRAHGAQALEILDRLVARDPRSVDDRARRAELLKDLGEVQGLSESPPWKGSTEAPPPPGVCAWHRRSRFAFDELRSEGVLDKARQASADYVSLTVAACDRRGGSRGARGGP